jgi:hypothetical protein
MYNLSRFRKKISARRDRSYSSPRPDFDTIYGFPVFLLHRRTARIHFKISVSIPLCTTIMCLPFIPPRSHPYALSCTITAVCNMRISSLLQKHNPAGGFPAGLLNITCSQLIFFWKFSCSFCISFHSDYCISVVIHCKYIWIMVV